MGIRVCGHKKSGDNIKMKKLTRKSQFKIQKSADFRLIKLRSLKSQFKIQQTTFMLLGVALFFILIFLFWVNIKYRGLHSQATQLEEDKAMLMVEYISGLTKFSCNQQYCIDTDKLMMLKNMTQYKDFWPANYIKIRKIYPTNTKEIECTLANYPNCNTFSVKSGGNSSIGTFIALCRHEKVDDYSVMKCELGRIAIGYNIK